MSEVCFSNSELFCACPNCNNCLPSRSVQCPAGGTDLCAHMGTLNQGPCTLDMCMGALQRSVFGLCP